jgi:hypothetical protein
MEGWMGVKSDLRDCLFSLYFCFSGHSVSSQPSMTKILYFTNRSVTPFMSTIYKKIGDITLRDFKNLFDRPGFYRFHFKTVDQEFGMVKEEVNFCAICFGALQINIGNTVW